MKFLELPAEWNHCITLGRWVCFQYYRGELRKGTQAKETDWITDIVESIVSRRLEWLRLMNGEYTKRNFSYKDACLGPIVEDVKMMSVDGSAPVRMDEMLLYGLVGRAFLAGVAQGRLAAEAIG